MTTSDPLPACPFCGLPIAPDEESVPENAYKWVRNREPASDIEAHLDCALRDDLCE
jgi:hypothetical protein